MFKLFHDPVLVPLVTERRRCLSSMRALRSRKARNRLEFSVIVLARGIKLWLNRFMRRDIAALTKEKVLSLFVFTK